MAHKPIYAKRYRLRQLRGETAYIDATPVRTHIATLVGAGWSIRSIAGVSGVSASTISKISIDKQTTVGPTTAAKVLRIKVKQIASRTSRPFAEPFVPRIGTTRRIQALLRMGWSHAAMRERCGIYTTNLLHQQGRWVARSTHDAVAAMYRDWSHQRGPSETTARRALRRGYASPADWSDIDHDEAPQLETDVDVESEAGIYLLDEYAHLTDLGVSHEQACRQLGVTPDAIAKAHQRSAS